MKRQSIKFIEEFDPVRKRRMIIKSQSLSGIVPSSKNENGIWFESALERDFALILEQNPDICYFEEQPVVIEYYSDGKNRTYTPDFYVEFKPESGKKPWLCEIKFRSELRSKFSKYKSRFIAAKDFCLSEGWEFKIFTEDYIRTPHLENINFLSRYNYNDLDGSCYQLVIRTISDLGITSPKEFMLTVQDAETNLKGRCLYALWYAIKMNDVGCELVNEKLTMNSEIWLSKKLTFNIIDE